MTRWSDISDLPWARHGVKPAKLQYLSLLLTCALVRLLSVSCIFGLCNGLPALPYVTPHTIKLVLT